MHDTEPHSDPSSGAFNNVKNRDGISEHRWNSDPQLPRSAFKSRNRRQPGHRTCRLNPWKLQFPRGSLDRDINRRYGSRGINNFPTDRRWTICGQAPRIAASADLRVVTTVCSESVDVVIPKRRVSMLCAGESLAIVLQPGKISDRQSA